MRIHFHGNCQAPALRTLLLELRPDWEVTATEVHAVSLADRARCEAAVAAADVVVLQPVSAGYRGVEWLSSDAVLAQAKPGVTRVVFPVIYFTGQHPDQRAYRHPGQHDLVAPFGVYQNASLVFMSLLGLSVPTMAAMLGSSELLPAEFVRRRFDASLTELLTRQQHAGTDIDVASIIAARGRREILFNVLNHPTRALLTAVLAKLSALLSLGLPPSPEGPEPLPHPTLPILPTVTNALGLPAGVNGLRCGYAGEWFPLHRYVERSAAFYTDPVRRAEWTSLFFADPWSLEVAQAVTGLARHEAGHRAAGALVHGLFEVLLGRAPSEAELQRDIMRADSPQAGTRLVDEFARCGEFRRRRPDFAKRYLSDMEPADPEVTA